MWYQTLLFCAFFVSSEQFQLLEDFTRILVPTLNSTNPHCKNESQFYMEELKKFKPWATEMFDASSKFPTGMFFGSTYDFGNFDECINVNEPIKSRYSLVHFHIEPKSKLNDTIWEHISKFEKDRSRTSRNDFHFSYCLPESCSAQDLQTSLEQVLQEFNTIYNFKITALLNPKFSQVKTEVVFSTSDITFITVVSVFTLIALLATGYDWLMKLDDLKKYKLKGHKHQFLMSFSIWTNLKKLSSDRKNDEGLQCIHGLKVFSMFFIIMGHRIMFGVGSPLLNPNFIENVYGRIEATVLLNGPIIVDTFFNISGFLACYLILTQFEKHGKKVTFIFLYVHRFIRITPAYAIVLAFYCTIFIKIGSGPLWLDRVQVEQERCISSWWANILYINNYINTDQICMFQSWYLTCDMHFFIVTPIIIWLLRKKPFLGVATLIGIIIASICVVFVTVYLNNENPILLLYMKFLKDPVVNNTFKNIYIPSHMRFSPYFIGMITGYIKFVMRSRNLKMPKYMVYMGWIICFFVIEITVYSAFIFYIPGKEYDPLTSAIYASMHHVTWSICISWMILAISEGNGDWVQPILNWKPFALMSRVTYTAFLVHGAIQIYTAATLRHPHYASIFNLIYETAADIVLSYFCAFILSMIFEAPILGMGNLLLKKDSKPDEALPTLEPKIKTTNCDLAEK